MGEKTSKTSRFAAFILIVVNLIAMIFFVLLFAVSMLVISSPSTLAAVVDNIGDATVKALLPRDILTVQLGVALAAVGAFFIVVTSMGLYGAVGRSPFLLFMYSVLILLLLMLECALLYYFSSGLLEKGLQTQDGHWTHLLRMAFRCCEHNSSTFNSQDQSLPWSCCGAEAHPNNCTLPYIFNKNCHQAITHWIYRYRTVLYTSLAVLHVILSSCAILRRTRSAAPLYS